jgi:DNA-binding NtrC family response regulator
MKAVLVREIGDGHIEQIPLLSDQIKVGRTRGDLVLQHTSVSREHAQLRRMTEGWVVSDEGSRNGTRVNGVAIARRILRDGDRICFGSLEYVFRQLDDQADLPSYASLHSGSQEMDESDDDDSLTCVPTQMPTGLREATVDSVLLLALRHFCAPSVDASDFQKALHLTVEDIAGLLDVRRVVFHLPALENAGKSIWIRAGLDRSRPGIVFPEERMLACANDRKTVSITAGREAPVSPERACDAVCATVRHGPLAGFMYVEGENDLSGKTAEIIQAAASGMEAGLAVWQKMMHAGSQRLRPEDNNSSSPLLVGHSPALQKAVRLARRAAAADATVLLRGESGTGKELFARLIFSESNRRNGPFVPVHCSAIEETLMGSALFGHEKGAFTGAVGLKKGLFETADGGTIFLDEIGELSHDAQVKLLRILQEGEFMRVGGTKPLHVDVRVVAATNRDLEAAMRDGVFREDLYYRLKVIQLDLPPLRQRREDIPDLVRHFIDVIGSTMPGRPAGVSDAAMQMLQNYGWPGNIRELRNIIERALVLVDGELIDVDDVPLEPHRAAVPAAPAGESLDAVERTHIQAVLAECDGNKKLAARRLGISRSSLYEKLKELDGPKR